MADHHHPTTVNADEVRAHFSPLLVPALGGVGIAGLALAFGLGLAQQDKLQYFYFSYLIAVCFFTSIALGGLFFLVITHLCRAGWSIVVRRLAEFVSSALPYMLVLFIPILLPLWLGSHALYSWNIFGEELAKDALIAGKSGYLNSTFFGIRTIFYFAVWGGMVWFYVRGSLRQDETGDKKITLSFQKWSAPGILVFALTITFAAVDWLMSLAPHWFSTIFGVYFFAGSAVAIFATLTLLEALTQKTGMIKGAITVEHRHDLGKLLFGFLFFWGYIAFSQYLLIWYGDIPEETTWYIARQNKGWEYVSIILLVGHFIIPMAGIMSRHVRRSRPAMVFWAIWMLAFHYLDLYYIVMPQRMPNHELLAPAFGIIDIACMIGVGGLFCAVIAWHAAGQALVPLKDPRLPESLAFHNA
jgi:hypothetical protein